MRFDWLSELLERFEDEHILVGHGWAKKLQPAHTLDIDAKDWGKAGSVGAAFGCRWVGLWGDHQGDQIIVNVCLEYEGDYLIIRTSVKTEAPLLASHTPYFRGADRLERHARDMLGLAFSDHPDKRRWTRHKAWEEDEYPLCNEFPVQGHMSDMAPPDGDYPFKKILGAGVYEIPVGPVHAGIIEPGHFRFSAVGETVLSLEQHLGYVHKGIEKIAVGCEPDSLVRLAGRVSGDSTVAYSWAACQALERATGCSVPQRADWLRGIFCERERIANHLGDIGAICNDVAFSFALYQFHRLREDWQRRSMALFGHRFMMDKIIPGGVAVDLDATSGAQLKKDHQQLRAELEKLYDILTDLPSLEDRLVTTGVLTQTTAKAFGVTGYVGKASGQTFDVRLANPYSPYHHLKVKVPEITGEDVMARMQVRMEEILGSLKLLDHLINSLPAGNISCNLPEVNAQVEGIGFVDGWRGEILVYVRLDENSKVQRFFPRDPSWFTWPALEQIQLNNIVPDFPVCNKSVNGSYSGHDL